LLGSRGLGRRQAISSLSTTFFSMGTGFLQETRTRSGFPDTMGIIKPDRRSIKAIANTWAN